MRLAYIFTTFPKLSEQFLLREVLELQRQGVAVDVYSIIGGGSDQSEAGPVRRMRFKDWVCLMIEVPYWLLHRPRVIFQALPKWLPFYYRSWINYGENVLGMVFALRFAREFQKLKYRGMHATWATAPGMVTYFKDQLIGGGYTLEAHAYDIFRDGGDAFLLEKLQAADAIRVSTEAARVELETRLRSIGMEDEKLPTLMNVRHGLALIPAYRPPVASYPKQPIKAISVGRLIEKKGYFQQLEIYRHWLDLGVEFKACIVGGGPLFKNINAAIRASGLENHVELTGALDHEQVAELYPKCNLFLFTGLVSKSGDRDGFPNVIGEAMSHSLPVFTTDVNGTTEGVINGRTGRVIDLLDSKKAAEMILGDIERPELIEAMTRAAHRWVLSEFNVTKNMEDMKQALWGTT
jgi:glycosyltransferase involved in cell wall biosynthesis